MVLMAAEAEPVDSPWVWRASVMVAVVKEEEARA